MRLSTHRLRPLAQLPLDLQELPRRLLVQPLSQTAQRSRDLQPCVGDLPLLLDPRRLLLSSSSLCSREGNGRIPSEESGLGSLEGGLGLDDVRGDLEVGVEVDVDLRKGRPGVRRAKWRGRGGARQATDLDDGHAHFEHLLACRVELSGLDERLESSLRVSALEVELGEVEVAHLEPRRWEGEGGELGRAVLSFSLAISSLVRFLTRQAPARKA